MKRPESDPSLRPSTGSWTGGLTAVQGVALGTGLNLCSRLLAWARQSFIVATFGLAIELDAFFVAASFVALYVNTFGDLFDSVGIPALVRARERGGPGALGNLARALFRRTLGVGAVLVAITLALSPLAPLIAPGLPTAARPLIVENLALLVPYALAFLPYHFLGSVFRSVRAFHVFSAADLLVNALALAVVVGLRQSVRAVPLSFSLAYVGGVVTLAVCAWRRLPRPAGPAPDGEIAWVRAGAAKMLPIYAVTPLLIVVDRSFASFLPVGSISALFYGYLLASLIPGLMSVENVLVTPFAETGDRSTLLTRVLSASWLLALPCLAFAVLAAEDLVSLVFGRGAFGAVEVAATGAALRYYALALPVLFVWPVCIRILQVSGRYAEVLFLAIASVACNGALDYLFVFGIPLGVRGIALATSVSWALMLPWVFRALRGAGVRPRWAEFAGVLPGSVLGVVAGGLIIGAGPLASWGVLLRGAVFVGAYVAIAGFLVRTGETTRLKEMVAFSFPALRRILLVEKGRTR